MTHIPKETWENSLLTEADRNFVIPERKMYYTLKKRGTYRLVTGIFGQFLGMYESVFP